MNWELKFTNHSRLKFGLNSMEFEIFDSIQRFMTMIRAQMMCLNLRDVTTLLP
jgi:hypothetical protein